MERRFRILRNAYFCGFHSVGKVEGRAIAERFRSDSTPPIQSDREINSDGWKMGSTTVTPELRAFQPLQLAILLF